MVNETEAAFPKNVVNGVSANQIDTKRAQLKLYQIVTKLVFLRIMKQAVKYVKKLQSVTEINTNIKEVRLAIKYFT